MTELADKQIITLGGEPGTASRVAAAMRGDHAEFGRLTEPYRRELQAHCYRIMGSLHDAEDIVQETFLRAWRRLSTYEGRSSFRAWLYKIATNACFDALQKHPKRFLVQPYQGPADPLSPPAGPIAEPVWLEPYPDEWLMMAESASGPEARYAVRESVTLAFMTALQALPPRQRAVLILRDVLDWPAREVADLLDMTLSAVNSALHRARETLERRYHRDGLDAAPRLPSDPTVLALLNRYVHAWEAADITTLVDLLQEDAILSMPPMPTWFRGRAAVVDFLAVIAFGGDAAGRWRLAPVQSNGQPAFGLYQRDDHGIYRAFGLQVLTIAADVGCVVAITSFMDPRWLRHFGLPDEMPV